MWVQSSPFRFGISAGTFLPKPVSPPGWWVISLCQRVTQIWEKTSGLTSVSVARRAIFSTPSQIWQSLCFTSVRARRASGSGPGARPLRTNLGQFVQFDTVGTEFVDLCSFLPNQLCVLFCRRRVVLQLAMSHPLVSSSYRSSKSMELKEAEGVHKPSFCDKLLGKGVDKHVCETRSHELDFGWSLVFFCLVVCQGASHNPSQPAAGQQKQSVGVCKQLHRVLVLCGRCMFCMFLTRLRIFFLAAAPQNTPWWRFFLRICLNNLWRQPTSIFSAWQCTFIAWLSSISHSAFCRVVSIPGISSIEPVTSITPLVIVLSITAIKEGYEDYVGSSLRYIIWRVTMS